MTFQRSPPGRRRQWEAAPTEGMFASWWGKCPRFVLRLSLIMQHLWWSTARDQGEPDRIGMGAIEAATGLMDDYLVLMTRRAFGQGALPEASRRAAALARAILARRPAIVNVREVYKAWKPNGLLTAEHVRQAVELLEQANWLRRAPEPSAGQAGRPREDWAVNPRLYGQ